MTSQCEEVARTWRRGDNIRVGCGYRIEEDGWLCGLMKEFLNVEMAE